MNTAVLTSPAIHDFRNSAVLRESLAEELKLPGISAALEALARNISDFSTPEPIPGLHPDSVVAREFCTKRGNQQILNTLKAMTVPVGKHALETEIAGMPAAFVGNLPAEYQDPRPPSQRTK